MPTRLIREGILTSERVCSLSWEEEVFYRRLMSVADDYGLCDARPDIIRATLYPLQLDKMSKCNIQRSLAACETAGLILLYSVNGKSFLQIKDFRQACRSLPKHPVPDGYEAIAIGKNCYQLQEVVSDNKQPKTTENNCLQPCTNAEAEAYPKAESKSEGGAPSRLVNQSPLPKSPDEVEAYLSSLVGACRLMLLPADVSECSKQYFADRGGTGWVDRNGVPILSWKDNAWAYAMRWARNVAGKPSQVQVSNDDPFEEGKRL